MPSLQQSNRSIRGVWVNSIAGRFRRISVHQLAIAWWLYQLSHITLRQLRIYFAANEMVERRQYTGPRKSCTEQGGQNNNPRQPRYTLEELASLLGCRTTKRNLHSLSSDLKTLDHLGLVKLSPHHIAFAVSIDQISIDDLSGFWTFFNLLPNSRRAVPIPRRTCRALAAGLGSATTGLTIALLIRSLFWHKDRGYRTDGRTKCSWVSEIFGLSRRSVQLARTKLIKLGWLTSIEADQWELNRWGQRYKINPEAFGPTPQESPKVQSKIQLAKPSPSGGGGDNRFAPPSSGSDNRFAPPYINQSSSSNEELKTNPPAPGSPVPQKSQKKNGFSIQKSGLGQGGRRTPQVLSQYQAIFRELRVDDLKSDRWLRELHPQLQKKGLLPSGERGLRELFALAERCLRVAHNPCAMFVANIRAGRWHYTTCEDEDAAMRRLKPKRIPQSSPHVYPFSETEPQLPGAGTRAVPLTGDARVVLTCRKVTASKKTHLSAQQLARIQWGWTTERWLEAEQELEDSTIPQNVTPGGFRGQGHDFILEEIMN